MHVIDAAYATVHDYPGGSESLAPRMGMSPAILRNKVNPNNTTHHLTVAEAMRMVGLTGDKRLMHAMALESGGVFLDAADEGDLVCDMAVLESVTAVFSRAGSLGGAVHSALSDSRLTASEIRKIEAEGYALRKKVLKLVNRLRTLQEPADA